MHLALKAKHLTKNKGVILSPVEILGLVGGFFQFGLAPVGPAAADGR